MQLIYPPRAKSIFIHSSAPVAESEKDFPHWNPQFLGPGPPPTAQTGHALESSNPDKQWLHKLHQLVSNQHELPCCPSAQAPGARMSPGQHVDPQDLSSLQLELKGQQGGRSVAAIRQPCPPSRSYRAVPAAPSRDANCAPDQAGPGNNGAHPNSASGGRLLVNSAPRGLGKVLALRE